MPPLHNNFRFCAEKYLFLVLIYHGIFFVGGGGFLFLFLDLAFLPSKERKRQKKIFFQAVKPYF